MLTLKMILPFTRGKKLETKTTYFHQALDHPPMPFLHVQDDPVHFRFVHFSNLIAALRTVPLCNHHSANNEDKLLFCQILG